MSKEFKKYRLHIGSAICCVVSIPCGTDLWNIKDKREDDPKLPKSVLYKADQDYLGIMLCHVNPKAPMEDRFVYVYLPPVPIADQNPPSDPYCEQMRQFLVTPKIMWDMFEKKVLEHGKNVHCIKLNELSLHYPHIVYDKEILNDGATRCFRSYDDPTSDQSVSEDDFNDMGLITGTSPYDWFPIHVTWPDGSKTHEKLSDLVLCHELNDQIAKKSE